jgi:hypothetical protein
MDTRYSLFRVTGHRSNRLFFLRTYDMLIFLPFYAPPSYTEEAH